MTHSVDQIAAIVEKRRSDRAPVIERMREIKDIVNAEIVIPLPEMDEQERPAVANLILVGIEQHATRITSVEPVLDFPPRDPEAPRSRDRAARRKGAVMGWWEHSDLQLADAQRARWFVGYGSAPAIIRPDFDAGMPCWEFRDPLDAYPPPSTGNPGRDMVPENCAFIHRQPFHWLRTNYPDKAFRLIGTRSPDEVDPSEMFDIIEWFDQTHTVLIGLANKRQSMYEERRDVTINTPSYLELTRAEHLTGMCPVVIPGRITLDQPRGQFDQAIGVYRAQAKMMALAMIATEKDVFPDVWLLSRQPGETPRIIAGPFDGRTGQINIAEGALQLLQQPIGPYTTQFIDKLENNARITAGIPNEFSGESGTNIRTGRRGEQIMNAVVSFPIAEAQKILAKARQQENRRAIAVAKAWFGNREKTFFVSGLNKAVTYLPVRDFETDVHAVFHPIAGVDANNLTIEVGQMVGVGLMSKRTAMTLHPHIPDAEKEYDSVTSEQLESALLAAISARAQAGLLPPGDVARIIQLVRSDKKELAEAVEQAQLEAQRRQASSGEPGTPEGPVAPGSPEAQPGLALPGEGAEQPVAAQGEPNLQEFLDLLGAAA